MSRRPCLPDETVKAAVARHAERSAAAEDSRFEIRFLLMLVGHWASFDCGKRAHRMADMTTLAHYGRMDPPDLAALLIRHGSGWPDELDEEGLVWFHGSKAAPHGIAGAGLTKRGWSAYRRISTGGELAVGDGGNEGDDDFDEDEPDEEEDD